jgi:hypothetical protein
MSVRVEVVCIAGDGSEQRREVMTIERRELAMETLGLTLKEGKALLAGVQDFWWHNRYSKIWSNGGGALNAANGTPAKIQATRQ